MNTPKLKPANENPWYILMTLYGEQEEDEVDHELHGKNRAAWNAWSCQNLTDEERAKLEVDRVKLPEVGAWDAMSDEVAERHREEFEKRNGSLSLASYEGIPAVAAVINLSEITFSNPIVLENVIFNSVANFNSATFSSDAYFDSAMFSSDVNFYFATFSSVADFYSATFSSAADFDSATFSSYADFGSATFSSATNFISAMFAAPARFVGTKFGDPDVPHPARLNLTDAQFEKPASFRKAVFLNRYPDFTGAIVHEGSLFPWEKENWPAACDQDAKEGRDSCAALRHHLAKQGLPEAEMFFFKREMGFAKQIGKWSERLPYLIYGWLSDYGHSIARPANCLLALWCWTLLIFTEGASMGPLEGLGYSFANMFKFFGLRGAYFSDIKAEDWDGWVQLASGGQTVAAFILLFFLGLGLRTRFRLR